MTTDEITYTIVFFIGSLIALLIFAFAFSKIALKFLKCDIENDNIKDDINKRLLKLRSQIENLEYEMDQLQYKQTGLNLYLNKLDDKLKKDLNDNSNKV
jgi:predicted transcriptional regulator